MSNVVHIDKFREKKQSQEVKQIISWTPSITENQNDKLKMALLDAREKIKKLCQVSRK